LFGADCERTLFFWDNWTMSRSISRILVYLALALTSFSVPHSVRASVGDMSGGALSSFGRLSPIQTVQYGGDCWYDNGWDGPGYYPCGNEWNSLGGVGADAPIVGTAIRRRHHHGVLVAHPHAANPIYPGAPSGRLGDAVPSAGLRGGAGARAFSASPHFHAGAATVTRAFPAADFTAPSAAAIFISFTPPHFLASARPSRPALQGALVCMGLAGPPERTSARLSRLALPASEVSTPAAELDLFLTSARQPRLVLLGAGFMALAGSELSRAAERASDRAALGIADRLGGIRGQ
jgi:hypothetical protein